MSGRPTVEFDHHSPDYARSWPEISAEVRSVCPVAWSDAHEGFWVVSGYEEAGAVAHDAEVFMNGRVNGRSSTFVPSLPIKIVPLETDPPLHTQVRRTLNPVFSTQMAAAWRPFAEQAADTLIDGFIERGEVDLQREYAKQLPAIVNLSLVGLPANPAELELQLDAPGIVVRMPEGSPEVKAAMEAIEKLAELTQELIRERRRHPRNDVTTVVAHMRFDGELGELDFLANLIQDIVSGGNGTTSALIAYTLIWLSENADQRARLIEEPGLMGTAMEEFLRVFPPALNMGRRARIDTVLGGQEIAEGSQLLISYAAANRDPRVFDAPDEVRIDREDNRHLSFGIGRHRCVGMHLAKVVARVAIERVLARLPDYVVDTERIVPYETTPLVNGVVNLPATFTPTARVGASMPAVGPDLPERVRVEPILED